MRLLVAERIKLVSTRSPWWCGAIAIALNVAGAALLVSLTPADAGPVPLSAVTTFLRLAMVVVMVMAAVSVTTEYRFGTIRTTFQAVPNRTAALLAKTAVVAVASAVIGLLASFGAWALAMMLKSGPQLALDTADAWRVVAGAGPMFAVAAVLALAVGILLRQTAGAVAVLLVWALLAEGILEILPNVGDDIRGWLPFANLANVLSDGTDPGLFGGPWGSLGYVTALAAVLLTVAVVVANRRDA